MTAERLGYRPGLDGLRAVAVSIVLLGHLSFQMGDRFPGVGTHGVTMFFTLSGFLITKLLLEEVHSTGRIGWRGFYRRRALRLLPALPLVVAACALVNHLEGFPVLVPVLTSTFYVHNAAVALHEAPSAFNHFWSLAVEEQFYLLWPITVWLVGPERLRRVCFWSVPVLLVVRLVGSGTALFDGLEQAGVTRIDALLVGGWLAMVVHKAPRRVHPAAVGAAAGMVGLWTMTGDHGQMAVTWGAAAVAVASCVLILWGLTLEYVPAPLIWLGRRSYGVYLWHAPIIWLVAPGFGLIPTVATTMLVAECSYRWIEEPFLARKRSSNPMGNHVGALADL